VVLSFKKFLSAVFELSRTNRQTNRHGDFHKRSVQLSFAKAPKEDKRCHVESLTAPSGRNSFAALWYKWNQLI